MTNSSIKFSTLENTQFLINNLLLWQIMYWNIRKIPRKIYINTRRKNINLFSILINIHSLKYVSCPLLASRKSFTLFTWCQYLLPTEPTWQDIYYELHYVPSVRGLDGPGLGPARRPVEARGPPRACPRKNLTGSGELGPKAHGLGRARA